jgi:hypothetical protein
MEENQDDAASAYGGPSRAGHVSPSQQEYTNGNRHPETPGRGTTERLSKNQHEKEEDSAPGGRSFSTARTLASGYGGFATLIAFVHGERVSAGLHLWEPTIVGCVPVSRIRTRDRQGFTFAMITAELKKQEATLWQTAASPA